MPGFNRRGPIGDGAMSGRGQGMCNRGNQFSGCGFGRRGGGMLNQERSQNIEVNADEFSNIKSEVAQLKSILETINKKITSLENI